MNGALRVSEVRPNLAAVKAKARALATATMRVEIEPRFGHVTITACGVIEGIWYDPHEAGRAHTEHVARATMAAIAAAEVRAGQWREREFREFGSFIR